MAFVRSNLAGYELRLAANVRGLRCARGLTQRELGVLAGLTEPEIERIERGGGGLSAAVAWTLCEALHVSADALFTGFAA